MKTKASCEVFSTGDIETDPFKEWVTPEQQRVPQAFAAGLYSAGKYYVFWGKDCLRRFVKKALEIGGVVYFHNGGNFDFHFLLPYIDPVRAEYLLIGKRIVQIKVMSRGKNPEVLLEFRDSYALIPRPLRDWDKMEIDIAKLEPEVRLKHKAEIIEYLKRDVLSLHSLVSEAKLRTEGDHLTQASAAFAKLKAKIGEKLPRITESFDKRFRPYYYAGRVQCDAYGLQVGEYDCFDINSAFPHSMLSLHWWGKKYLRRDDIPGECLEQCFITVRGISHGCFPYRHPKSVKVDYPRGEYTFNVTGWEYKTALELGLFHPLEVITVYQPAELMSYEDFILPLYEEKLQAEILKDLAARLFTKLEMNSAYGKFGQDPDNYTEVVCRLYGYPMPEPWVHRLDDIENGFTFWSRKLHDGSVSAEEKPKQYNNVCIAASITGKVRADLMRARHITGAIYCDTDSIICPRGNGHSLKVGTGLGEWKHEFTFHKLWLGGKKLYAGHGYDPAKGDEIGTGKWKKASKGVRLSPQQIIKVCEGDIVRSNFDAPSFSILSGTRFISRKTRRLDLHSDN